jgi:hypothetical protein
MEGYFGAACCAAALLCGFLAVAGAERFAKMLATCLWLGAMAAVALGIV